MSRILMFAAAFFMMGWENVVMGEEPVFTLYVTRHAQRGPRSQWPEADKEKNVCGDIVDGKVDRPREISISPKGEQQCLLLGRHLQKLGFSGSVQSSPSYRAMQTAVCVLNAMGSKAKIFPEPQLQSGGNRPNPERGMTVAEMQKRFPDRVENVVLPEFWKYAQEFTTEQRNARMEKFLTELIKKGPKGDILLVGHSSTLPSLIIAINKRMTDSKMVISHYPEYIVNCCLYVFRFNKDGKVIDAELENWNYLPTEMQTLNFTNPRTIPPWKKNKFLKSYKKTN